MHKNDELYLKNWESAKEWQNVANKNKQTDYSRWLFDCGFKLDFDGELISFTSRFYPPTPHSPVWDGTIRLVIGEKVLKERKITAASLDELKKEAEACVSELKIKIECFAKTL
tara:strand:- start:8075 stop:8413 length:339 start_codon:yes stop_codon:yes gene_type:complete